MPESTPTDELGGSVNRAPEGQGVRAGPATQKGEPIQQSVFDGAGNEIVVVTETDEQGQRKQGTGADAAEAMADAQDKSEPIGEDFGTTSGQAGH